MFRNDNNHLSPMESDKMRDRNAEKGETESECVKGSEMTEIYQGIVE